MFRLPVVSGAISQKSQIRFKSSNYIRNTYVEYFVEKHGHKHVKSSSVVPLCDPTVPFVNAGMNQFKGVFLGIVDPPCVRAVNSQKCVRVGGKHNDLDVVGMDGHHHTFFEMLGNWSFGDYYKKEACQMAWDLLLGPYRLKPENLMVTYFSGDAVIGLPEDRECRDIWRAIGVPESRIVGRGARDNFWEMGAAGPCGPCTELHYVHPDGTLTEIWNIVFIQCNREENGAVTALRRQHVDTGMGLERMAALLQGVPSNYDTDLFAPLLRTIEKNSKGVSAYSGSYKADATVDQMYRRLADHSRMISVCLADGVYPATSLNLKQIMRKTFKICTDVFQNPQLVSLLYNDVVNTLGPTYPELVAREKDAKLIIDHERESYAKLRAGLKKKWNELAQVYPEVEAMGDVELAGFALGYKEFKETMAKQNSTVIPGELVFKLYDTHGFQEDIIERIAAINNLCIDKKGFWKLLSQHKARHKTAFKEQAAKKGLQFDKAVENLVKNGVTSTNDRHKYEYLIKNSKIVFNPLNTKLVAILNEDAEWIDFSEPSENRPYYLVTESTNFYCEEGGQTADTGNIKFNDNVKFKVETVFKIRDFVFHKGHFSVNGENYISNDSKVMLEVDSDRRLNIMRNHTAVHLLNAAIRRVLGNSVICQVGSRVTEKGLSLNLTVYGEKLSQKSILETQELVRESIKCNAAVETRVLNSTQLASEDSVLTVPGETYPETGLRIVSCTPPLVSKELCCGTHVPSTGVLEDFCITLVRGAGGLAPTLHALTGDAASEARELFCRAEKLSQVIELAEPERVKSESALIRRTLVELCGTHGAPYGEYANCLKLLENLQKKSANNTDLALHAIAEAEISAALAEASGRRFVVQFLRCSYLMQSAAVRAAVARADPATPTLLLGCAGGVLVAAANVPKVGRFVVQVLRCSYLMQSAAVRAAVTRAGVVVAAVNMLEDMATDSFNAERWLRCILPIFQADIVPTKNKCTQNFAEMTATKVSLISCEQMVQDAMRVAIKFAQFHLKDFQHIGNNTKDRQRN